MSKGGRHISLFGRGLWQGKIITGRVWASERDRLRMRGRGVSQGVGYRVVVRPHDPCNPLSPCTGRYRWGETRLVRPSFLPLSHVHAHRHIHTGTDTETHTHIHTLTLTQGTLGCTKRQPAINPKTTTR